MTQTPALLGKNTVKRVKQVKTYAALSESEVMILRNVVKRELRFLTESVQGQKENKSYFWNLSDVNHKDVAAVKMMYDAFKVASNDLKKNKARINKLVRIQKKLRNLV